MLQEDVAMIEGEQPQDTLEYNNMRDIAGDNLVQGERQEQVRDAGNPRGNNANAQIGDGVVPARGNENDDVF